MPISPARRTAYDILRRLESGRDFAVDLLQRREVSALKDVDRRLATELVMGVVRWRGELDFQIAQFSGKKVAGFDSEVLAVLRLGAYQIRFLERVPRHAVVNDSVELIKAARKRSAGPRAITCPRFSPTRSGPVSACRGHGCLRRCRARF